MKRFFSFLLTAGLLLGAAACGDDDDNAGGNPDTGNNGGGDQTKFSCMISVAGITDTEAKVSVEVNDATTPYKLWVVKVADYAKEVPAEAVDCTGNTKDKVFSGLTPDEEYYAVVYEESLGYKTKDFLTEEAAVVYDCLNGSDYYILAMDGVTAAKIEGKTTKNLASDDLTMFFDWWNGAAFTPGTCSGPNFFGETEGWYSLIINPVDWFGGCFRLINPKPEDIVEPGADGTVPDGKVTQAAYDEAMARREAMKNITAEHVLHLAMRSAKSGNYNVTMLSGNAVQIGDETSTYGFKRDNNWHEIEIPMSAFMSGANFSFDDVNVLAFTQGEGPLPANLDFDAAFIYKK